MENTEQHLLEEPVIKLVPASVGKRFTNYIIDIILFSVLATFLMFLTAPYYPLANKFMNKQPFAFMDQLMLSFFYGLYISAMEAAFKGKTIGKYITGTRAVAENGLPVNSQTAFIRGLLRLIPFEQISAISLSFAPLGLLPPYTWHDRWSRSFVIDEVQSDLPKTT